MKLYNTETKKKEEIAPQKIRYYACGPTVYDRAHIGNLRTYLNEDILRRVLGYLGYGVDFVMNITDIEDKIINKSLQEKIPYREITRKYEGYFWDDLAKLHIQKPPKTPHATDPDVISKMIEIIKTLLDRGIAYSSDDGSVYFSIAKFPGYGRLAELKNVNLRSGARVAHDEYDKEDVQDFVLWKAKKEGEPSWSAPFGEGRPGWHIECTAMALLNLGEQIDIHAGGVDNIFPHHENELAQSEAYTGKKFVAHWFHGEHLLVEGKRMGKSENNFYSIDEMTKRFGVEPLAFRMLILQSHYRDKLNFTEKSIKDAQNTLNNLRNFVNRISQSNGKTSTKKIIDKSEKDFEKAISDDLAMPKAMAVIFEMINEVNKIHDPKKEPILDFIYKIEQVLGLGISPEKANERVQRLFLQYQKAKKNSEWEKSDQIRSEIENLGWVTEDLKCKSILRKK